ncbi:hypothetical protein R6Q59_005922 [Mikania micrantha]
MDLKIFKEEIAGETTNKRSESRSLGSSPKNSSGQLSGLGSKSKDLGNKDSFLRADKIDFKSWDVQLDKHLSRYNHVKPLLHSSCFLHLLLSSVRLSSLHPPPPYQTRHILNLTPSSTASSSELLPSNITTISTPTLKSFVKSSIQPFVSSVLSLFSDDHFSLTMDLKIFKEEIAGETTNKRSESRSLGSSPKNSSGQLSGLGSKSKDLGNKDSFLRADKIDFKSWDVQLDKHLSRVW